jgi:hypothetical protein
MGNFVKNKKSQAQKAQGIASDPLLSRDGGNRNDRAAGVAVHTAVPSPDTGPSPDVPLAYGSVCSGIEAATVAWHDLGWKPAWFSEIEKFPSAVLKHRYPDVPNLGDMTKLEDHAGRTRIDLLVGGTPCQSFSVAGLRKGMADARGNLALVFILLLRRAHARWVLWENVPGVLSSGNDFGCFLGGLVGGGRARPGESSHPGLTTTASRGGFSMHSISESPNDAVASSLSGILETGDLPQRFFLSERACAGILRRAEKRGKTLPPALEHALRATGTTGGGRTRL